VRVQTARYARPMSSDRPIQPAPSAPPVAIVSREALWHEWRWCLFGPDLLANPGLPLFRWSPDQEALLDSLEPPPQPLLRRLGRRFEQHWHHAFATLPGWRVHGEGIQIRLQGRTLGELDLLVEGDGEVWHLELAVKFYLCLRGQSGDAWSDWVGPGGRDRLDRKLERMGTHQLQICETTEARAILEELSLPSPTRSAAILRGVRFADWQAPRADAEGRWCTLSEVDTALPRARVLTRTEWLGFGDGPAADWLHGPALRAAILHQGAHHAVQTVDPNGTRWLVMPDR
jgi:hypothetical protein